MIEKFIIEITDHHSNTCYFDGILHNQIQFVFGIENARKMNLCQSVINYDQCKMDGEKLGLSFEIKEI